MKPQTPFDRAVAQAAEEFRRELAEARAEDAAKECADASYSFDALPWLTVGYFLGLALCVAMLFAKDLTTFLVIAIPAGALLIAPFICEVVPAIRKRI